MTDKQKHMALLDLEISKHLMHITDVPPDKQIAMIRNATAIAMRSAEDYGTSVPVKWTDIVESNFGVTLLIDYVLAYGRPWLQSVVVMRSE